MSEALLRVENLSIGYDAGIGQIQALRAANLEAHGGEVIGIVGESGCGKSTLAAALINLLAPNAHVNSGAIYYKGADILTMDKESQRHLRGPEIAMVFQDPMTTFNPVITMGDQLVDFQHHIEGVSNTEKRRRAGELLARVGIPDPELCLRRYPHELSGGMRQRASIAAALLMTPNVLVADEPTTALDVTMEAQIIHLLRELRTDYQGAIIVVTHHLGVVAELCDRVYVMYAGQVVEQGLVDDIYHAPKHPYTRALIACDPAHFEEHTPILPTITGRVPSLLHPPVGCSFADRCDLAISRCREMAPPWVRISETQFALCHEARP
ncbi:MAG: ABC transporter ATP-binding protein [Aestuariivirga sp.]|nr:ABC transporter ATP-binding protein [Aestuariivirga sp.]